MWGVLAAHLAYCALWLLAVARAVGLREFLHYDPSPEAVRASGRRAAIAAAVVAGLAAYAAVGRLHPEPAAFVFGIDALFAIYTAWVIARIRRRDGEQTIRVRR